VKLVISSDHAGFPLKEEVRAYLENAGHEIVDLGAYTVDPLDDYPDFAEKVGLAIKRAMRRAAF
jgi:ribose 5-phosphate isomerase B